MSNFWQLLFPRYLGFMGVQVGSLNVIIFVHLAGEKCTFACFFTSLPILRLISPNKLLQDYLNPRDKMEPSKQIRGSYLGWPDNSWRWAEGFL